MTVSAHDVARELSYRLSDLGAVKAHKLLYYCQGWFLAWTGKRLFSERLEAWDNGPVVADLWHDLRRGRALPAPQALDEEAHVVIDFVVSRYGRLSARELIDLTHAESPWTNAVADGGPNAEIGEDLLLAHFRSDEEQLALQRLADLLVNDDDVRRAVEASSTHRHDAPVDDSDTLRHMLEGLGRR